MTERRQQAKARASTTRTTKPAATPAGTQSALPAAPQAHAAPPDVDHQASSVRRSPRPGELAHSEPAPAIQPAPDSPADRRHQVSSVATARPNNTANAGGESQTATSSQPEWLSFERFKLPDDILNHITFDPAWNPRQELLRFYGDPPQDKESKAALSKALNPGEVRRSVLSALSVANGEGVLNASLRQLEFWVCSLWIAFGYRGECRPRLDAALNELAESGLIRVSPALGRAYGHRERVRVSLDRPDAPVNVPPKPTKDTKPRRHDKETLERKAGRILRENPLRSIRDLKHALGVRSTKTVYDLTAWNNNQVQLRAQGIERRRIGKIVSLREDQIAALEAEQKEEADEDGIELDR